MPSKNALEQKQKVVSDLAEKLKKATAGVLVNYAGITVEQDTALRAALRKAGVEYKVYKNTLTGLACEQVGYGSIKKHLNGMSAIAISNNDPVTAAKIIKEYTEKVPAFEIKAGFVDGTVIDAKTVAALAEIPPKEVLIAKLLGSLQAPLYGLAYLLQAKIDKENAGSEAAPAAEAANA